MTKQNQFFYIMQLFGGTFPSGGFSQSWGLETYVAQKKIQDGQGFSEFLEVYLDSVISSCEGPILCHGYTLAKVWDWEMVQELEELSCAARVTRESRESSLRMGKAFLRIMTEILEDRELCLLQERYGAKGISYPVAYGLICGKLGLEQKACVEAFVFSTVNALVQSAVKLIPLGNTQAQKMLFHMQQAMADAASESMRRSISEISNFCPGLDIASIAHESLPVRLYMS